MALDNDSGLAGDINWSSSDLPYMWEMVSGHESSPYQPALDGWRRSYELVLMHRTQVEAYKDKLVQAWPPERNKASQAYVERLDQLIESLNETYEAAVSNYTTFSSAISAVASAKSNMKPLQEEYASNTTLLAKYEEDLKHRPTKYTPPDSPVAGGRQEQLRQQAAVIMTSLSAELAAAQTSLVLPRPYSPKSAFNDQSESLPVSSTGPAIPAISTPFSGSSTTRTRSSASIISKPVPGSSRNTPRNRPVEKPGSERPPSQGPILGGTKPAQNPPSTGFPTPPTTTTNPPTNTPGLTNPSTIGRTIPSPSTMPPRNYTPTGIAPPATGSTGTRGGALPNNGVIGGNSAIGGGMPGRPGQSGAAGRGGQRVNPAGGIIGGQGSGGIGGHPGRRQDSKNNEDSKDRRWDPDNPWETTDGVDPILLPAPEQRIDPGPTIGGR